VSIYGAYAEDTVQALANLPLYIDNPHLIKLAVNDTCESVVRKQFPELFCHPADATDQTDWGRAELGYDNRVSPSQLRDLFGWTLSGRLRNRCVAGVRRAKAMVPQPMKEVIKRAIRPHLRYERAERRRLDHMPRYTAGRTRLFGRWFEFVDAGTYLDMLDQQFGRGIYRFASNTDEPTIIDGGANIGLSVLYFKCLYPASKVVAFEADPAIFDVLERNCKSYELKGVELIPKAIWTSEGFVRFEQEGSLSGRISAAEETGTVTVPSCRLGEYLNRPVDLLKLDIEGAETEVLLDCSAQLNRVANIFVEHHSFVNKPQDFHVLVHLLHDAGFRLLVEPATVVTHPLLGRRTGSMDCQMNVFGFRT
jgi:FkbM family methyltransferase